MGWRVGSVGGGGWAARTDCRDASVEGAMGRQQPEGMVSQGLQMENRPSDATGAPATSVAV